MDTTPQRYVIVGGSAAGMAAAQSIRQTDPAGAVHVLSEETDPPYFRPLIPFLVSGRKRAREMALQGAGPYTAPGITVHTGTPVQSVDTAAERVVTRDGRQFDYSRLLIATGSRPVVPPDIEGTQIDGVYALRTLADARRAAERAGNARRAVMLGGGLLNLKFAFALLERGLAVTLVVHSPEVLSQLMEPGDAVRIREALNGAGLEVMTGRSGRRIIGNGTGVTAVALDDGGTLACQMVCIGKGVRPNAGFLAGSGIALDDGVVADRYTRTSAPGVYTAGDVAVTYDPVTDRRVVTGLWTNAVEMGRCAGFNMAGRPTVYTGTFGILNATQVADEPFVSMGVVHTDGTDYRVFRQSTADAYRKLVLAPDGGRLLGAVLVGDISRAGLYRLLIRERRPVGHLMAALRSNSLHYGHLLKGPPS